MNDLFSWHRLRAFAVKYYTERWKSYLSTLLGSICLLTFLSVLFFREGDESLFVGFLFGWVIQLLIWIRIELKTYADPATRIAAFTLPVSVGEKYLFCWFNSLVTGTVCYMIAYLVVDVLFGMLFGVSFHLFTYLGDEDGAWGMLGTGILLTHAFVFFCHAAFGKRYVMAVIAMLIALLLSVGLWYGMIYGLTDAMAQGTFQVPGAMKVTLSDSRMYFSYCLIWPVFVLFIKHVVWWLTWMVLFCAGYFKFKERQVK